MIRLVKTCGGCPEQYDALYGDKKVGYLRLRHGHFYVECPDVGGDNVYSSHTNGDGIFDDDERHYHLSHAVSAIQEWIESGEPHTPDVKYIIEESP